MTNTVFNNATKQDVDSVYTNSAFMQMQLQYLHQILPNNQFTLKEVSQKEGLRHKGDFYRLLAFLNIPSECYWLTMHLYGLKAPYEFDGVLNDTAIAVVKQSYVQDLARAYNISVS